MFIISPRGWQGAGIDEETLNGSLPQASPLSQRISLRRWGFMGDNPKGETCGATASHKTGFGRSGMEHDDVPLLLNR